MQSGEKVERRFTAVAKKVLDPQTSDYDIARYLTVSFTEEFVEVKRLNSMRDYL